MRDDAVSLAPTGGPTEPTLADYAGPLPGPKVPIAVDLACSASRSVIYRLGSRFLM